MELMAASESYWIAFYPFVRFLKGSFRESPRLVDTNLSDLILIYVESCRESMLTWTGHLPSLGVCRPHMLSWPVQAMIEDTQI